MPIEGGGEGGGTLFGACQAGVEEFTLSTFSGTLYTQNVAVTNSPSIGIVKANTKKIAANAANAARTIKSAQVVRLIAASSSARMARGIGKIVAATAANAAQALISRLKFAAVVVAQATSALVTRSPAKVILAGASSTARCVKAVSTTLLFVVSNAQTIFTGNFHTVLIAVTSAATTLLGRMAGKVVTVTQTNGITFQKAISKTVLAPANSLGKIMAGHLRFAIVSALSVGSAALKKTPRKNILSQAAIAPHIIKTIGKRLLARAANLTGVGHMYLYARLLTVTQPSNSALVRSVSKPFIIISIPVVGIGKGIGKTWGIVCASVPLVGKIKQAVVLIPVLSNSALGFVKGITHTLATISAAGVVGVVKTPVKNFLIAQGSAIILGKSVGKVLSVTQNTILMLSRLHLAQIVLAIVQGTTLSIGKSVTRLLTLPVASTLSMGKGIAKSCAAFTSPLLIQGKGIAKTLTTVTSPLLALGKGVAKNLTVFTSPLGTLGRGFSKLVVAGVSTAARTVKIAGKIVSTAASASPVTQALRVKIQKIQVICAPAVSLVSSLYNRIITQITPGGRKG